MHEKILAAVKNHDTWRGQCINIVPSENVASPQVRKLLDSDMLNRYYFPEPVKTKGGITYNFRGGKYIDEVYKAGERIAGELFGVEWADLRVLAGHHADIAVLMAFCRPGDTIVCTDPDGGGYPGFSLENLPSYFCLETAYLPYDEQTLDIKEEESIELILEKKPKVVILSSSFALFPHPVRELSQACREEGIPLVYDASHTLGLVAGKQFQNPIEEGADIMIGSTHKTLPGPQGGIIMGNVGEDVIRKICNYGITDNAHYNRIASLTLALLEMQEFGADYAKAIVENSQLLAKYLEAGGIEVAFKDRGYTTSHQIKLAAQPNYADLTKNLEKANIITDDSGRLGTSEVTRYGMRKNEMKIIAELIVEINNKGYSEKVRQSVIELKDSFKEIQYCFSQS